MTKIESGSQKNQISFVFFLVGAVLLSACASAPKEVKSEPPKAQASAASAADAVAKEDEDIEIKPIQAIATPMVEELPADKIIEPVFTDAQKPAPTVAYPTAPNTYMVEARAKDSTHPAYHDGHTLGFALNGELGRDIVVKRGETVTFQVRTGVQHDFYISTNPAGWGAAVFTEGVRGQFTYDGDVTVETSATTPDVLYYQCRNHKLMGGRVFVVATDADVKAKLAELANEREQRAAQTAKKIPATSADENKLKQKVAYINMILQFKADKISPEQKKLVAQKLEQVKQFQTAGKIDDAIMIADEANALLSGKTQASGPSEQELAEQKADFEAILLTARSFQDAHEASYAEAKKQKRKAVDYDRKVVEALFGDAESLAKQKKYKDAEQVVAKAERLITTALNEMLGSQTLVYEVTFETPKDEYDYEVKRYLSYEELVPVAIETRKPNEQTLKLMQTFVDKAKFFRGKADESAAKANYAEALAIIRDATAEVRRGLMAVGVSM